ncbi:MAG: ABC transporter ATP-binding protein [Phycisphaerales bacterium]
MNPPPPLPPEIVAEDVRRSFGERQVLRGISLSVSPGDLVGIVGSSGCGKTVLLDHLTGLMTPDAGRVLAADHTRSDSPLVDLTTLNSDELDVVRLHWQIVFQRNALFSGSVFDNIALWLEEHTEMDEQAITARVRESLAAVALDVDDVIYKDRDALSGGMAKRVAIARAIATDPRMLFYDEPTTGLDPVVGGRIHDLIWDVHHRPLHSAGAAAQTRTTLVVTHDKDLLRRMRPRIVMLERGSICFAGTYEEFTRSDNPVAVEYLQAMPVLHARPWQ